MRVEVHQMVRNSKRMKAGEIERELGLVGVEVGRIGSLVSTWCDSAVRRRGREAAIASSSSSSSSSSC